MSATLTQFLVHDLVYECAPPAQPVDRFLVSPVRRQALITGRLVQLAIVSVIQLLIVIALGLLVGRPIPRRRDRPGRADGLLGPAGGVAALRPGE